MFLTSEIFPQICHNIQTKGWQVTRDDAEVERMGPIATQGLQWVGFDDSKTIRQKSQFVLDQGFGGAMIWALDLVSKSCIKSHLV